MKKIAVVLLNLGGPHTLNDVKSFLFNLFYDYHIIRLPNPFRYLLAKLISHMRNKHAQAIYKHLGNKSPILEQTMEQKKALENALKNNKNQYKVFIAMRYWHPMSLETIKQVYEYNPDETILLPLYPQFSTTTTLSSFNEWKKHFKHHSKLHRICCYYDNKYFISSHIKLLNQVLDILDSNTEVLFSAHGLPQKIIDSGDPYQKQIVSSINLIIQGIRTDITTTVCYQSKVGPMKWLQPSLLDAIKNSTKTNIVIVPIAFVSEHSETLFELDIEAREFIESIGKKYFRIPTLGVQEDYIECLVDLCKKPHKNKMCDICVNNKTLCGMEAYAELKKNSAMR